MCTHTYRSVEVGREKYVAGDYVLLHGTKKQLICRVISFVKNMTDSQATANIEWIYWPDEMAKQLCNIPAKKRPKMPDYIPGDVFLSNVKDSAGIDSIACKVSIIQQPPLQPSPSHMMRHNDNQYYAHWHWDVNTKRFTPVRQGLGLKTSWLGAVIAATSTPTTPTPKTTTIERGIRTRRTMSAKSHSFASASGNPLGRELTVNISRSPTTPSPLRLRRNKTGQPLSSSPKSNGATKALAFTAKSLPCKPISNTVTPHKSQTKPSAGSTRLFTPNTYIVNVVGGLKSPIEEHPLPQVTNEKTPSIAVRNMAGDKEKRKKQNIPRRDSKMNVCDVVILLSEDEDESEDEEEEDDEILVTNKRRTLEQSRKNTLDIGSQSSKRSLCDRVKKKYECKTADDIEDETKTSRFAKTVVGTTQRSRRGRDVGNQMKERDGEEEEDRGGNDRKIGEGKRKREEIDEREWNREEIGERGVNSGEEMGKTDTRRKNVKDKWKRQAVGKKRRQQKVNEDAIDDSRIDGSECNHVLADILTSPTGSLPDILTTPTQKGRLLRTKSQMKPPAYLAADDCLVGPLKNNRQDEINQLKKKKTSLSRKRNRSPRADWDVLVTEPEGKRIKHTSPSSPLILEKNAQCVSSRDENLKDDVPGQNKSDSCSENVVQTTPKDKVYSLRPHTVPRNKYTGTATMIKDGSTVARQHKVSVRDGVLRDSGWKRITSAKKNRVSEKMTTRSSSLSSSRNQVSIHEDVHETEEEESKYELSSSEGESSNSGTEDGEEEEEEPYQLPVKQSKSQRRQCSQSALCKPSTSTVANWSPDTLNYKDHSRTLQTKQSSKTPRQKKTPHTAKASKTPRRTSAAMRTPRSRVPITPHIPQKKMKTSGTGMTGKNDLDKARLK